ncbi:MAG: hypothetical protein ACRD5R_16805 [Candidatus Acidiferrales bacterium]
MKRTYDIFKKLPNIGLIWVEAVEGLELARSRAHELVSITSGEYLVYDLTQMQVMDSAAK